MIQIIYSNSPIGYCKTGGVFFPLAFRWAQNRPLPIHQNWGKSELESISQYHMMKSRFLDVKTLSSMWAHVEDQRRVGGGEFEINKIYMKTQVIQITIVGGLSCKFSYAHPESFCGTNQAYPTGFARNHPNCTKWQTHVLLRLCTNPPTHFSAAKPNSKAAAVNGCFDECAFAIQSPSGGFPASSQSKLHAFDNS